MSNKSEDIGQRIQSLLERLERQRESVKLQWMKNIIGKDMVFITSLHQSYKKYFRLTPRQEECFSDIEIRYREERFREECSWYENFSSELRERMEVAAQYYLRRGEYFYNLSSRITNDSSFIPNEKQYRALVENKYAAKVLEEHYKQPLYEERSMVVIRDLKSNRGAQFISYPEYNVRPNLFYHHGNDICLVLKTNAAPIYSSCKGASQYLLLPVGKQNPIIVEERFLKKYRKKSD